jgi:hypothetical protein
LSLLSGGVDGRLIASDNVTQQFDWFAFIILEVIVWIRIDDYERSGFIEVFTDVSVGSSVMLTDISSEWSARS